MKTSKYTLLLLFIFMIGISPSSLAQHMENNPMLVKGKIKTSYINYNDGAWEEPNYTLIEDKKISEIYDVVVVDGDVSQLTFRHREYGRLRYGRVFVARGNKNDDGTLDNVFGYYSDQADIWAIPYKGSIYFINSSIRNCTSSKELFIHLVMGENIVDRMELFNYYKEIYATYSGEKFEREEAESKEKQMAKEMEEEALLNNFSIERNNIESIKVIHKWSPHINFGERSVIIGIEAVLENGNTIKSKIFDGVAIDEEFIYEVEGAHDFDQYRPTSDGGYCNLYVSYQERPTHDDCVKVKVKRRSTGELLAEDKINIDYDYSLYFSYKGSGGIRGFEGDDGADIDLYIEQIPHSETGEPIILYTIAYDYGNYNYDETPNKGVRYVKLNPDAELKINYSGGDGGNGNTGGYNGGKPGTLTLHVSENVESYKLSHWGGEGSSGYADYQGSTNTDNNYDTETSSNEIIIVNNTGKGVCIVQGGSSRTIGSKETYDCDDDIYYGIMNGSNCTSSKGSKIASADGDCGRTITIE